MAKQVDLEKYIHRKRVWEGIKDKHEGIENVLANQLDIEIGFVKSWNRVPEYYEEHVCQLLGFSREKFYLN